MGRDKKKGKHKSDGKKSYGARQGRGIKNSGMYVQLKNFNLRCNSDKSSAFSPSVFLSLPHNALDLFHILQVLSSASPM